MLIMDAKETKVIIIGGAGHGVSVAVAKAAMMAHEVTLVDIMSEECHLTDMEKREISEIGNRLNSMPEPYIMEMLPEPDCSIYLDDYKKENVKFYDHYYKKNKKHKK